MKKEDYSCPDDFLDSSWCSRQFIYDSIYHYTSGWIESKASYNIQYGYIESRIKLPLGKGFWPAFWTYRGRGETGNAAEIDIFEMTGNDPLIMGTNIHEAYCDTGEIAEKRYLLPYCSSPYLLWYGIHVEIPDYTEWRTYAIEWSPTKIIWYVDGVVVRNTFNPGIVDPIRVIVKFHKVVNDNLLVI